MAKTNKAKHTCLYCGNNYVETNFYNSYSRLFSGIGKIPYCKQCIEKFYQQYYDEYINEGCLTPEKTAIERVCMTFDIYYTDVVFNSAMNKIRESNKSTLRRRNRQGEIYFFRQNILLKKKKI